MKSILRPTFCILALLAVLQMMSSPLHSQTTATGPFLFGVINICTPVIAIDSCNSTLVVKKSLGFKADDRVILIQMQGTMINITDSSTYGDVVSLGTAGNYELTTIEKVIGNTIQLKYRLERPYEVKGSVQLVRVPHYTGNATIIDSLVAPKWDGKCGGVVALIVDSILHFEGKISASGCGFRGGLLAAPGDSTDQQGYDYTIASGRSGIKGESIVINSANTRSGRGKRANGGGGGNAFHSGGGGGGNAGEGGRGGRQFDSAVGGADSIGGVGGVVTTDTTVSDRLIMGGGGGSGHHNGYYDNGIRGGAGGGIVFVRCKILNLRNSRLIESKGENVETIVDSSGAGGGGGGGSILLDYDTTDVIQPTDEMYISVVGGSGGSVDGPGGDLCVGPGGGGGAGRILVSTAVTMPTNYIRNIQGGNSGSVANGSGTCSGGSSDYGAVSGFDGYVMQSVIVVESMTPR